MTMVDTEVTAIPAAKGDRSHGHGCEGEPQPRLRAAASAAKGNHCHGLLLCRVLGVLTSQSHKVGLVDWDRLGNEKITLS